MKVLISAESTIDLSKELLDQYNIKVIPYTVLLGETVGYDGDITPQKIFDYVDKTGILPKTSAINEFQYEEYFKGLLEECDVVIHITLSSEISSAHANAIACVNNSFKGKVFIIDSKSLSTGIALLAIYASNLAKQGLAPEEIVERTLKRRDGLCVSFVVNTLSYLYKGGRCSKLERFGANLLKIRPKIIVTSEGKMVPGKKYFGRSVGVVASYVEDTLAKNSNFDKEICFVTHSCATKEMVDEAVKLVKEAGFKNVLVTTAGATITSHCGPKTLGILYFNDGGEN